MGKKKKLTIKQRKFIDLYLETGNATEAAMQSYNVKDRESAAAVGYETLRNLQTDELMEKAGISDKRLLEKLNEGLDASKRQRDFETGEVFYDADYSTRHKYLKTALELKGKTRDNDTPSVQVNILNSLKDDKEKYGL